MPRNIEHRGNLRSSLLLTGLSCFLSSCVISRDDQGNTHYLDGPIAVPVKLGLAVGKEIVNPSISLEIMEDSGCQRITPRDNFRLILVKKIVDKPDIEIFDQFVSDQNFVLKGDGLAHSTFEAIIQHQDHPEWKTRRRFQVTDANVTINLSLPCLDSR